MARERSHDVVQVDVGVAPERELYSWPGAGSFSNLDLFELVGHGLLSTGTFAGFASNVFVGNQGIVHSRGESNIGGRRTFHFQFEVSSLESRWTINWMGKTGRLGEAGEFWVNADDLHLIRMRVDAQEIPGNLFIRSVQLVIDYGLNEGALLPTGASLIVIEDNGTVHSETIAFSHCHVFAVESTLKLNDDEVATVLNQYERRRSMLPPGLNVVAVLSQSIDLKHAQVGQEIEARLASKIQVGETLVPAGAILKGRIRVLSPVESETNAFMIGVAFDELYAGDTLYRFLAKMTSMQSLAGIQNNISHSRFDRGGSLAGPAVSGTSDITMGRQIPGVATLFLVGTKSVPEGFRMTWRTLAMAQGEQRNPKQ